MKTNLSRAIGASRGIVDALCVASVSLSVVLLLTVGAFSGSARADVQSHQSGSDGVVLDTDGGLVLESKDGKYKFSLGGRIQYDYWQRDGSFNRPDGSQEDDFEARRLRLELSSQVAQWQFKLGYDLQDADGRSDDSGITDAYVRYTGWGDWARLTLGRHKVPFSMDELASSNDILALERNILAQAFAPGRAEGFSIGGFSDHFSYQINVFQDDEVSRGENSNASFAARVTWAPLRDEAAVVHLGVSAMERDVTLGTHAFLTNTGTTGTVVVANQAEAGHNFNSEVRGRGADELFFGPLVADGINALGLEFAFSGSGFLFQAEYMDVEFHDATSLILSRPLPEGATATVRGLGADFDAYSAQLSWVLTGESHPYNASKGVFERVSPQLPSGAWEVFVRYSSMDARSKESYITTPDPDLNPMGAVWDHYRALTYGVNWYSSDNLRVALNYVVAEIERTAASGRLAGTVGAQSEEVAPLVDGDAFALRLQYVF